MVRKSVTRRRRRPRESFRRSRRRGIPSAVAPISIENVPHTPPVRRDVFILRHIAPRASRYGHDKWYFVRAGSSAGRTRLFRFRPRLGSPKHHFTFLCEYADRWRAFPRFRPCTVLADKRVAPPSICLSVCLFCRRCLQI